MEAKLGEKLKAHRQERKLSIKALSEKTGIHSTYLHRIEKGERRPSATVLRELAEPLGFSEAELLKLGGYLSTDQVDDRIERFKESLKTEIDSTMSDLKGKVDSL